ncbi:FMN-linked oxidoreductase [Gymnopus androsaceus JB14]|uniref:FMN-linked oxidoreductase n=1 Tax=Gymnopus androsaceus JB14 TaxID=1447944 RepID=A0A6A4I3B2_9AGAR|nr:FMN-linked oxidoreductase [Gymnopus androsaceus JB14]
MFKTQAFPQFVHEIRRSAHSPLAVSASDIPLPDYPTPRPLTIDEIAEYTELYAIAAKNSIEAGFDGVEIHGANGYLTYPTNAQMPTEDPSRTDVGLLSKSSIKSFKPLEQRRLGFDFPRGARSKQWEWTILDPHSPTSFNKSNIFIHLLRIYTVVEPRINGNVDTDEAHAEASNDFLRKIWHPKRFITAGGYKPEAAFAAAEKYKNEGELVAFGRYFLSTPDLPERLRKNIPLNPYNRDTFYLPGDVSGLGYTDYPFATTASAE